MKTEGRSPKTDIKLPEELAEDLQNKWEAFCHAAEKAQITVADDPVLSLSLKRVFALSDFVARSCIKDPAMLADLVQRDELRQPYAPTLYTQRLKAALAAAADETALNRILRRVRRREMVRIAWRDLTGAADLTATMTDLSALADACLQETLDLLYQWQCSEYGIPTSADGFPQCLVILGLGKLGSRELNFSSDIDLMLAYPKAGATRGSSRTLTNEDFFARLGRRLIKVIGQPTADGLVFRVDLRLRPFGENGPLAMSFDAIEHYYQEQGREWERYALIKARVAAGDQAAGADLLQRLNPFIYRRYLDYGVYEALRNMKQMIAVEVKRQGLQNNIKLGPGGIREIEFFGQVFQLIRGGVTPALQERSIQRVLKALAQENYIPQAVCDELNAAYVFLRNSEHRLQEFSDQQTHDLPSAPLARTRLAAAMGFENPESFLQTLSRHRERVHAHFQMLLATDEADTPEKAIEKQLRGIWQELIGKAQACQILSAVGFTHPDRVLELFDYLREHPETRALSRLGHQRLDQLIPRVLLEVGQTNQPETDLGRLIDLIKTIERRTSYLALLLENPTALAHLVKLANASPWLATFLARHPVLLDELLDPRTLYRPPDLKQSKGELQRQIQALPDQDLEYQIEALCIFKQVNILRVAAADVSGALPLMRVSDYLSEIAETVLGEIIELAWDHLVFKHGLPDCRVNGKRCERGFAVIAYGKLGGLELGYGSDLDLVFLHAGSEGPTAGGDRPIDHAQFFNRLGQRIIHLLTSHTRAGKLYEIDMRLRPSGSGGVLVSHMDAFRDYQMQSAWTWEHQALIRARAVSGEAMMIRRFEQVRREALARPRPQAELKDAVRNMRERMRRELLRPEPGVFDLKQDTGGIVDIEFLVQYLVLLKSCEHPELVQWTDNVRLIQTLIETGAIDEYTAHLLKHAYLIYRAAAHQLSLQEKPAKVPADSYHRLRQSVQTVWNAFLAPP
ncbi:MAG: bifunctional [glutamate--ammonia ligase]-adenylyl-L-tyrosine phosphorylase/[glutamate--ammonia-ligase] adenylyltransferase [Desulfobacterales bacterium]|nr:MAG: bifunctional [glutamate--ammonia ligase]-adenylyl-L-tyrosine phosphorylase/[glutamate--ammonia-ligase] adenylyltransferase [Desulfobacterales bacterium]